MVYTKIILMLFFARCLANCISITDESYFRIEPPRPLFGDTVSVSCRMVAPEGYSFYRTEPEVAFDEDSKLQCSPSQIGVRAIEGVDTERFFAHRSPDGDRTNVSLVIEIRNFSAVDVGLKISCINKLHIQQNYRDRKIVLSGVLQNAAPPPPPTNVIVRAPPHSPLLTCQSQLAVTWDNVPGNRTLTDVPVERYSVSVNVGGVVQFATVYSGDNPILVNLEFGSYSNEIQAEVYSMNSAGVSSPAVSNVMEIYRPEIVNLTVRAHKELSLIYLQWKFKTNNPDWLLDVSYSLVVAFRKSVNGSENIFKTRFSTPSDITYYILRTTLATEEIETVTLHRIKICNQVLKDQNNSLTYLQNATYNPTLVAIKTTSHVLPENDTVITRNVTQFITQNVTQDVPQNVTQVIIQNVTEFIPQNITEVITTITLGPHTNTLLNHNHTARMVLNSEHSYVVTPVLIATIIILLVVVAVLTVVIVLCFIYHKRNRGGEERAGREYPGP